MSDAIEEFKKRQESIDAEIQASKQILLDELAVLRKRIAEIEVVLASYSRAVDVPRKRNTKEDRIEAVLAYLTDTKEASRAEIMALLRLSNIDEIMNTMQQRGLVKKRRGYGGKYRLAEPKKASP